MDELRGSRLPLGWTPLELVKQLTWVEFRRLEWGFEGRVVHDPWGDTRDGRWHVDAEETPEALLTALHVQAERTNVVVRGNPLDRTGRPGPRWDGARPPTLERILLHLVQEYARHLGQLDIVAELANGQTGE